MKLLEYVDEHFGKRAVLARQIGVKQIMITMWIKGRARIPAERCIQIEKITGGKVTCEEMRPDIDWAVVRMPKNNIATPSES